MVHSCLHHAFKKQLSSSRDYIKGNVSVRNFAEDDFSSKRKVPGRDFRHQDVSALPAPRCRLLCLPLLLRSAWNGSAAASGANFTKKYIFKFLTFLHFSISTFSILHFYISTFLQHCNYVSFV